MGATDGVEVVGETVGDPVAGVPTGNFEVPCKETATIAATTTLMRNGAPTSFIASCDSQRCAGLNLRVAERNAT